MRRGLVSPCLCGWGVALPQDQVVRVTRGAKQLCRAVRHSTVPSSAQGGAAEVQGGMVCSHNDLSEQLLGPVKTNK